MVSASLAQGVRGDASRGERLFKDLKCSTCHSVDGVGGKSAPSLGGSGYTPNTMAGAMWSHVTAMWQAMDRAGIKRPQRTEQQAADLYAFFAGGFNPDKPGDASKSTRASSVLPATTPSKRARPDSPGGPGGLLLLLDGVLALDARSGMLSRMVAKNLQWQQLSTDEVGNLMAYLNTKK